MKNRFLAGVTALALAMVACNLGSSIPSLGSSSSSNFSQAVDPNTQPIPVSTTLDQSHTATAIIGPAGGTLSATGAENGTFKLYHKPQ